MESKTSHSPESTANRITPCVPPRMTPIAPVIPRRFPHDLEVQIEVWDLDRNELSWPAWFDEASA